MQIELGARKQIYKKLLTKKWRNASRIRITSSKLISMVALSQIGYQYHISWFFEYRAQRLILLLYFCEIRIIYGVFNQRTATLAISAELFPICCNIAIFEFIIVLWLLFKHLWLRVAEFYAFLIRISLICWL